MLLTLKRCLKNKSQDTNANKVKMVLKRGVCAANSLKLRLLAPVAGGNVTALCCLSTLVLLRLIGCFLWACALIGGLLRHFLQVVLAEEHVVGDDADAADALDDLYDDAQLRVAQVHLMQRVHLIHQT